MALYLTRCPTVVSLQQLEDDNKTQLNARAGECPVPSPEAPVANCAGTRFPRYNFATEKHKVPRTTSFQSICVVPDIDNSSTDSAPNSAASSDDEDSAVPHQTLELGEVAQKSLLDTILLALWEDCAEQGLFRYDVTACPTKVLPGIYGFIAQLNEGRATKKRPTEFRVDQVCQDFDPSKFNFTKAYMREVLFQFEPSATGRTTVDDSACANRSPNLVIINVSPIEFGHVLLVPKVLDNITQIVDPSTVLLALQFASEADNPYLRVGYNSLGAYATINHLHFQAYYLAAPFPCERAPTAPLDNAKRKRGGTRIARLVNFPVNGFVVEGCDMEEVAATVGQACIRMQEKNIPHNLLITDAGARVFIWPQCFAEKQAKGLVPEELLDTGVNPACWEIAGHMVLKRKEDYDAISQDMAWRLLEQVSLSEERFQEVARLCFG